MKNYILLTLATISAVSSFAQIEPRGTLRGRFLDDLFRQGIPKARVILSGPTLRDPLIADSDAAGSFSFSGVAAGTYRMAVEKAGYFPPDVSEVQISAGSNIDAGDAVLIRKRRISGTIRWQDGEPVATADVAYFPLIAGKARVEALSGGARTRELGEYSFSELRPGRYVVVATHSGYYGQRSGLPARIGLPTFFPSGSTLVAAGTIDVRTRESVSDVNITLEEKTGVVVEVRILSSASSPVGTGGLLTLSPPGLATDFLALLNVKAGDVVKFLAVPEGRYTLTLSSDREFSRRAQTLIVGSAAVRDVQISMPDMIPWDLKAEIEEMSGGQSKISAAAGITIRAQTPVLGRFGMTGGRTDKDGGFKKTDVSPGDTYSMEFQALPAGAYVHSVMQGTRTQNTSPFQFVANAEQVRVLLRKDSGTVSGTMFTDNGSATEGFVVLAPRNRKDTLRFRTAASGKDGTFKFVGVAPGEYDVFAFSRDDEGWYQDEEYLRRYAGRAVALEVKPNGSGIVQPKLITVAP